MSLLKIKKNKLVAQSTHHGAPLHLGQPEGGGGLQLCLPAADHEGALQPAPTGVLNKILSGLIVII